MKRARSAATAALMLIGFAAPADAGGLSDPAAPLGEWPDFTPIGFMTAPHPNNPAIQTHLYGDWGAIVGEETIFIQGDELKLLYHSYHETYLTRRPLAEDVSAGWALGYDAATKVKFTPLALPGGPASGSAWAHTDTPAYLHHPVTGEHLLYNTVRPGTKGQNPAWNGIPGIESSLQVSTSATAPAIGVPFTQAYQDALVAELWWEAGWNNNGEIKGGLSEPSPVWVPHLGKVRLFYRGLHGAVGSYWNWRISYADSVDGKTNWVKNPIPVWDPSVPTNPAHQWTQPWPNGYGFRGSWQAHCTGDEGADGVHMVMCVSNQNFAGGGALAYYWSPDWGDTWVGHPSNPILLPGTHVDGVPSTGFQRTPSLVVDEEHDRYILAYNAGHDTAQSWKRRTHLAIASRPSTVAPPVLTGVQPSTIPAFRAGTLTLTGTGFAGATELDVGGVKLVAAEFTVVDDTTITCEAPTATALGAAGVTVTTGAGTSAAFSIAVVETAPPKLDAPSLLLTSSQGTWSYGGGSSDLFFLLMSLSNSTFLYQGDSVLQQFVIVQTGGLDAVGAGGFGFPIPGGLVGATIWSQLATLDEQTGAYVAVSDIESSLVFF